MKNGLVKYNGNKFWYQDDELHRINGPAVELSNGDKCWYKNGGRHRLEGPAIERANGDKEWWINGGRHRLEGPAIERANGDKHWYQDGKLHRENGPAIEYANGDKYWYIHLGTDSRGYDFYQYKKNNNKIWRIEAGCRDFTLLQAKRHWKNNPEALALVKSKNLVTQEKNHEKWFD